MTKITKQPWQKSPSRREGKPKPKPNQHLQSHTYGDCEVAKENKMMEMTQSTRSLSKMKRSTSSSSEISRAQSLCLRNRGR
ncbi:hypothetical protein C1H46_009703 [Malus baccata]|uniref:Uncharacterized protein n=1 Tax=Malus baccata TaxID=106549 RepID=A0A540N2G8_MALBA|nr:hypothetical protein C1H46_009703 [Malus baccata]